MKCPVGWRQQRAEGVLPASLGNGAVGGRCSLPREGHRGLNFRREGLALFVPAFEHTRGKPPESVPFSLVALKSGLQRGVLAPKVCVTNSFSYQFYLLFP